MVLTDKDIARLSKLYYEEGYTLGRDAIYSVLKKEYKKPPSKKDISEWLSKQKLNQVYAQTRKGGSVQSFKPTKPFESLSADLIDFTNKPAQQFRYILVVIDNFSRYMYVEAMTGKTATKTAKAMAKILEKVEEERGRRPRYVQADDGPEFKGDYAKLLAKLKIDKRRTLAGQPQSNGLVERANGKLKQIIFKNKEIFKGTWKSNLNRAAKVYNNYENRTTGYSPSDAAKLSGSDIKKLKDNVAKTQKDENRAQGKAYKVGDRVRLKKPKGKLDKMSTPNWSQEIYTIQKVIAGSGSKAPTYIIKGRPSDLRYTRNDVQIITGRVEDIPNVATSTSTVQKQQPSKTQKAQVGKSTRRPVLTGNAKFTKISRIVGKKIKVRFDDGEDYVGLVKAYNKNTQQHKVFYEFDGKTKIHNFTRPKSDDYIARKNWEIVDQ